MSLLFYEFHGLQAASFWWTARSDMYAHNPNVHACWLTDLAVG